MMVPLQQRRRRRRALPRTAERRLVVARGVGGFGFTIAGQRPCVVSAVAAGGPAERAGLRAGDALLAVDGANVARAPHASVARMVAAAPGAISLSVAPRESPPTDTEDTEPDERARTRRRHPPPRRRPQAMLHHPACQALPSTSGLSETLQNLSRAQLTPNHASRLECRAVVGYLGTIETPQAAATAAPGNVRSAVRKLRQERRPATPVLLSVLPAVLILRRQTGQVLAQYQRERIVYAGCGSDADRRYFGLVTSAEMTDSEASHSCHVFAVDPRMSEHDMHTNRAREFQIACTRDPVAERCLEFPPSAEYVVGVIRGMYSLPPDDYASPTLQQISKLAVKGDSPGLGNFSRCSRAVFRGPRDRRPPCRHDDARIDGQDFVANSPQPSNHSEITTTSSNSDSGIGFNNDCRNIADRILVVDFAGQQPDANKFRQEVPRRPIGMVGCSSFDSDGSFLSNTTPVVDGFAGQGRPLNLDDVILNSNDLQSVRHVSPRKDEDNYNYNNIYGNLPSTSRFNGAVYDNVYTENEGHYELIPAQLDLDVDRVTETFNSVEIYEERSRQGDYQSNESVENVTVISGGTSKASMDSVSVYSCRSHEEARPSRRRHLQASLDDMLVLGLRDPPPAQDKDEGTFVHPASVKCKVRKSIKPLNILMKTRDILTGRDKDKEKAKMDARRRAISASAEDMCAGEDKVTGDMHGDALSAAASEPDLRDTQSEQSSPFRRWTTGSGAGSSYRHHDHRTMFNKQLSECGRQASSDTNSTSGSWGGVARWSLGLEALLADPKGVAAFSDFLEKEFANENIRFWWAVEEYKRTESAIRRAELAREIWRRHLADGAPEPVNIDATARRVTIEGLQEELPAKNIFELAANQVFNIMKFDSYPRFLRSPQHAECARAELRGKPLPYQNQESSLVKLKKSASNASERRRSGGGSLLPWRSRQARDRSAGPTTADAATITTPSLGQTSPKPGPSSPQPGPSTREDDKPPLPLTGPPSPSPGPSDFHLPPSKHCLFNHSHLSSTEVTPGNSLERVDVVKTSLLNGGTCSLCRVVLPDGATSVVGVDQSLPIRRLVDRLLQRRNLLCFNYDVLLKDAKKGESPVLDPNSPSTLIGGREVVVERRCVVRMEVCGRCVAVRCRPARRLRHVLRPVMARYASPSALQRPRAVLRDGNVVNPDTCMQELDGARLQIVELSEEGDSARSERRDDDTDSLSDLALGLPDEHKDDAQCTVSNTSRSGCSSNSAGRVRAALRPGPPLHHHPPDFLENLRETQRQRLQTKGEPCPRTPPPLPPKPARTPTLV